jgi:hypothetical protein
MCDYYDDAVNVALEAWPAVWVGVTEQYVVREKPYEVCKSHLHASDRTDLVNMQNVFACGFIAWGFLLSADVGGNAGDNAVGFVGTVALCFFFFNTPQHNGESVSSFIAHTANSLFRSRR